MTINLSGFNFRFTKYIVSHFKNNVSSLCNFCNEYDELVSHLFWSCGVVSLFLSELKAFLLSLNFDFSPDKAQLLFGFHDLPFTHPSNYIILLCKRYIWVTKFQGCQLSMGRFKYLLKTVVVDLKIIFSNKGEEYKFTAWEPIENALAE